RVFRSLTRHRTAFRFPLIATAVENFHFLVTEQPERPKRVTRPPVRLVTVKNASGIRRDAMAAAKPRKFLRRYVIANQRILKIGAPIDVYRAGDMAGVIKQNVLV